MDPVRNPYTPGAGSRPQALVGREFEINSMSVAIQRLNLGRPAKSQMLIGLRGVGKTVLLQEFGRTAKLHGWAHEQVEITEDLRFEEVMATLVRKALLRLSIGRRTADKFKRSLGVLSAFKARWHLPDRGDISLEIDPMLGIADSGILDTDLAELFIEVGELAKENNSGVLFTIDEVQYLSQRNLASLTVALHRVSQERLPLIVAGGGLPSIPGLAGEAKSYAERLFDFIRIDSLEPTEADRALSEPATDEGVTWEPAALKHVGNVAKGYPYFIQEFGKQTWDTACGDSTITKFDVEEAVPLAIAQLDNGFFRVRIDRTPEKEREYLKAMASLGVGPYGSGQIANVLKRTTGQLGPVRDNLIKRGLCYSPRWSEIDFTVPMFDEFVRRALGPPEE